MSEQNGPSQKDVLGRSRIFTPEVVNDIHIKAELGRYRMRGFSVFKPMPHWDELVFLPGTLTRFVIEGYREKCDTTTVLGARFAKNPITLDIPIYITGMSFGALSLEAKMALAKGASMAGTATCSGEGGMIPPERDYSTKWYYQCIQSRYGFNPHHLMLADACEFFIGQGCKVGLGGHLMGQKVTEQVAEMRSLPAGIDQRSPARHPDWLGPDDLSLKVQEIREATDYRIPIQLKLGASRVYDDVRMAAKCGPDIIYLDGAEGGTGAGPHIATEETGIPLMAAIPEARRALEDVGLADEIDLVVAGGIRNGADVAKCLALGREGRRARPLGAHGAELQQGDPGRHGLRGHGRRSRRPVLPLPHRPLPGGNHHAGSGAPQAPGRRGRGESRLQLPHRADHGAADARAGMRQDERALPGARGPRGADGRGLGYGARAARGNDLHGRPDRARDPLRGAAPARDQGRGGARRQPDRAGHGPPFGGRMSSHDLAYTEPEKIKSLDAEFLSGHRFPYQEDLALVEDVDLMAATPGEDINWLEDIALLEEDGVPAVFDRYSNAFLKIYFPIPDGREDEIARKVLVTHLQSGNSYGIQLKEQHTKFPQPELGPWVEGSKTVGTDYTPPVLEGWEKPAGH